MSETTKNLDTLSIPIKLSFPVICINTFEASRAENTLRQVAESVGKHFHVMPFSQVPSPPIMQGVVGDANKAEKQGVVVFDPFFFDRQRSNPETLPALKSSLIYLENEGVNYVIAGKESLNEEFAYHIDLPPMDHEEIVQLIRTCEANIREEGVFDDEERSVIANHARGLSHTQMKNVFTYIAYLKFKDQPFMGEIRKEKAHILKDIGLGVLESISIDDVGGLNQLKDFLHVRKAGWDRDLPVKGVLLAGVPGGGKTLIAKATAGVLGTTLVRLDMGRFYSKYLGETERQFNRALSTIEEIAPVVVLIDEIEKFFGSTEGEHEVSKRLLGAFLYWLQERKNKVFIVATANRVMSLPPELMRAGRWDRAFFIDLPTAIERRRIFEIHLGKHDLEAGDFDLEKLVGLTDGYTGSEIEQSVIDALYLANAGDQVVSQGVLETAVERITPTSVTRRHEIEEIRRLRDQGFYPANEAAAEIAAGNKNRKIVMEDMS